MYWLFRSDVTPLSPAIVTVSSELLTVRVAAVPDAATLRPSWVMTFSMRAWIDAPVAVLLLANSATVVRAATLSEPA